MQELLATLGFDERMLRARAVILVVEQLSRETLLGSVACEVATRARQGGVPAYAVARESSLDLFDARILDLQVILRGRGTVAAGGGKAPGRDHLSDRPGIPGRGVTTPRRASAHGGARRPTAAPGGGRRRPRRGEQPEARRKPALTAEAGHQNVMRLFSPCARRRIGEPQRGHGRPPRA